MTKAEIVGLVLLWPLARNFIKETPAPAFSCEFGELFKNNFYIEHL